MQRRVNVRPRFWVFLIVAMLICFSMSSAVAQLHYSRVADRVNDLSVERLAIAARIKDLNSRLNYVRTDAYIERVARDELNMIMPGEIRYVSN